MSFTLTDAARQYIGLFEELTGATARDCVVLEDPARVVFVVAAGEMATAIGPDGRTVARVEERLGKRVSLVEDADTPAACVASARAPAAVYDVTIEEEDGERVAYADVDGADMGVAIGSGGSNIETARLLAARHFDLADIQLV